MLMPRSLRRVGPVVLACLALPLAGISPAHASTQVGGPFLGLTGYYDYSDSGIRDTVAGTETHWWCGDLPGHTTDTILQEQYRLSDWTVTVPERQVLAEGPAGAWDSQYTCNPTVVRGSFINPFGDGVSYGYAMYYVGTTSGSDNSIGAAFSNDGAAWRKYPTPVLQFPDTGHGYYGYAQPNATLAGGRVQLLFEDWDAPAVPVPGPQPTGSAAAARARALTVPGQPPIEHMKTKTAATVPAQVGSHWYATANSDGVTFASPAPITAAGLPAPTPAWGGAAYDPQDGRWYAAFNDGVRSSATTGGVAERGDAGVTLYATADLTAGTWSPLDTVDTVTTGSESNFLAGLLRDPSGNLSPAFLPGIKVDLSQSWPRPAYNAYGSTLGDSGGFNQWQIGWTLWQPGQPWRILQRVETGPAYHEVTTGWWDASVYHLESSLGKLAEAPTGTASTALYSCKAGATDYFVSPDAACEGQYRAGIEGYAYTTPAADRLPLYRCVSGGGHFVSTDPRCEGQRTEGLLGYSQN